MINPISLNLIHDPFTDHQGVRGEVCIRFKLALDIIVNRMTFHESPLYLIRVANNMDLAIPLRRNINVEGHEMICYVTGALEDSNVRVSACLRFWVITRINYFALYPVRVPPLLGVHRFGSRICNINGYFLPWRVHNMASSHEVMFGEKKGGPIVYKGSAFGKLFYSNDARRGVFGDDQVRMFMLT